MIKIKNTNIKEDKEDKEDKRVRKDRKHKENITITSEMMKSEILMKKAQLSKDQ